MASARIASSTVRQPGRSAESALSCATTILAAGRWQGSHLAASHRPSARAQAVLPCAPRTRTTGPSSARPWPARKQSCRARPWPGINPANSPRASSLAVRALCAHPWLALGPPLVRAQAVLPCAPCARTTGPPSARPCPAQRTRAFTPAKPPAKGSAHRPKIFFNFFQKPPCAISANVIHLRQFKGQNRFTMSL